MGTDISARLFAGIRVQANVTSEVITKYHEDTGKPYTKVIDATYYMIGDRKMTYEDIDAAFSGESENDLTYFHEQDSDEYCVIGIEIADTGTNRSHDADPIKPIPFEEVESKMKLAEQELAKYNVPKDEVLLCLVSEISY